MMEKVMIWASKNAPQNVKQPMSMIKKNLAVFAQK